MSAHWSEYWGSGQLTSLPADFAANYDGEIAAFWEAQFQGVPERGRVLDLCTGNGAIALLAAMYFTAQQRAVDVTAVDAAKINPGRMAQRHPELAQGIAKVRFIDQSPVETLPLPDGEFDLVTSQYGIEYCDWTRAAAQVARVLRPGGRLALVCHAASTDIVATMERESRDYEKLASLGLLKGIRRFLDGTLSFSRLRKLLQAAQAELLPAFNAMRAPLFGYVLKMLESAVSMDQAQLRARRMELAAFADRLEQGQLRLADMLRVNRAIHETPDWHRVFEAAGLRPLDSHEILYRGRHRSGHAYLFARPVE